jgi:hypothetical protein
MAIRNAKQLIHEHVTKWADVSAAPHNRGPRGTAWFVDEVEIGHIHGNSLVDIALPRETVDEVVAAGRAQPHHMFPKLGISIPLDTLEDVDRAVELLRLSYELVRQKQGLDPAENGD